MHINSKNNPNKICTVCKIPVNEQNTRPSEWKAHNYVCITCSQTRKNVESKVWRKKNGEHRRLYENAWRKNAKEEIIRHYSAGTLACKHCGFTDSRALSVDHINGNGTKHRKEIGNAAKFYRWLKVNDYPEGFQILCMNCNWIKRFENNEHGKQNG